MKNPICDHHQLSCHQLGSSHSRSSALIIVLVWLVSHPVFSSAEPPANERLTKMPMALFQTSSSVTRYANDPYAAARRKLVETRIRTAGVRNAEVLNSIANTPRHEFVPPSVRGQAYFDMALPIGASQTISSPFIVASMTETLDPKPSDRVLEIGTGSGYQAAVLSPLVADVYTIEIVPELGQQAARVLHRLDYHNVHTRIGDGFLGWPEAAPFDKIIVTCSPESVPQPLVDQLVEGGTMIVPVGERYQQTLYQMKKVNGELERLPLRPTLFVPMTGKAEDGREALPDPADPQLVNGSFDVLPGPDDPEGFVPGWYYGRQLRWVNDVGQRMVRFENETPGLGAHLLQGIAIDGTLVRMIRLAGRVRVRDVQKGPDSDSLPMIAISYYDSMRKSLGTVSLGPYRGSRDWKSDSRLIRVPATAREAIVRIGLFGATGQADFDDIEISVIR